MFSGMSLKELRKYRDYIRRETFPSECLSDTMKKLLNLEIERRENGGNSWQERINKFSEI